MKISHIPTQKHLFDLSPINNRSSLVFYNLLWTTFCLFTQPIDKGLQQYLYDLNYHHLCVFKQAHQFHWSISFTKITTVIMIVYSCTSQILPQSFIIFRSLPTSIDVLIHHPTPWRVHAVSSVASSHPHHELPGAIGAKGSTS